MNLAHFTVQSPKSPIAIFHFKIPPLKKTDYIYQMLCPAQQEMQQTQNWQTSSPQWTGPHSMS